MERAVPILSSHDLDETLAFSLRLGFEDSGGPHREWNYLIISRGNAELHFWGDPSGDPLTTFSCYLRVADADALHAEWEHIGVPCDESNGSRLEPPVTTDYGTREFALIDPSGNLIRAGSPPS